MSEPEWCDECGSPWEECACRDPAWPIAAVQLGKVLHDAIEAVTEGGEEGLTPPA